ncbi:MAG: UMP kinase [Candidatus Bathyarchaeota archaeon]|nr:UMP kinase [Candidatus Bathyarchaeota archaeon]
MRIVLRIGGSVVASPLNPDLIRQYVHVLKMLKKQGHEIAVVVGGGSLARELIKVAKELKLDEADQDELAIAISRVLAQLLLKKLGRLCGKSVATTVGEATEWLHKGKIVVMGGLRPGMTTDAVAALVAERVKADLLVKGTDQEGVYDKDPRSHPDAVKLDSLKFTDLQGVLAEDQHKAGLHQILDPEAVKVLKRQRIKVVVVNGFKPENVLAVVRGERVGTLVS